MRSPKQGNKSRKRTPEGQMSKKRVAGVTHKLLGSQCRVDSLGLLLCKMETMIVTISQGEIKIK